MNLIFTILFSLIVSNILTAQEIEDRKRMYNDQIDSMLTEERKVDLLKPKPYDNMPMLKPDPNKKFTMPTFKPDSSIVYKMPFFKQEYYRKELPGTTKKFFPVPPK